MSTKKIIIISSVTAVILCILAALYTGLSVYYADNFSYGTWINGIYCTGKSVPEAAELLEAQYRENSGECMAVTMEDGSVMQLDFEAIGLQYDFSQSLEALKAQQDPWLWFQYLFARDNRIAPVISMDEEAYERTYKKCFSDFCQKYEKDYCVYIERTTEGYQLVNDKKHVWDWKTDEARIKEAILSGREDFDLTSEGTYHDFPLSTEELRTLDLWEDVKDFQQCDIIYHFGEDEEPVNGSVVCDWLIPDGEGGFVYDEDGRLAWDKEKLEAYMDVLAERYNTLGGIREFHSTRGDTVTIEGGTYGNQFQVKSEKKWLYETFLAVKNGTWTGELPVVREPEYVKTAKRQGKDDIGDTYIEIDMGQQQLYYYQDGTLKLSTPIVTGNMMRKRGTPSMVCYVYGKQKNRVLRGPGYAAYVKYWMPVKNGIGIHDAAWRDEFGGEIYKTDGSHGCINTPDEAMAKLYEMVEIGTPVVMFY